MTTAPTYEGPPSVTANRSASSALVITFGTLLGLSLAFDYSVHLGGLAHLYFHDIATVAVALVGVYAAIRRSAALPRAKVFRFPLALFGFLLLNTVVLGLVNYPSVSSAMHKLFWFEHGDAVRIVGELLVWTWAFGQLDPSPGETWKIFDLATWGATAGVATTGAYWLATNTPHTSTTPFDLTVMIGLPLSMVFLLRRRFRLADIARTALLGGSTVLLYSRTSIITLAVVTIAMLIAVRNWRMVAEALAPVAAGMLLVTGIPFAVAALSAGPQPSVAAGPSPRVVTPLPTTGSSTPQPTMSPLPTGPLPNRNVTPTTSRTASLPSAIWRAISIGDFNLAPYTLPSRLAIWKDAIRIFAKSPVVGVGYHDYFIYSHITEIKDASRFDPPDLYSSLIKQGHNDFLTWLAETGAIGLLLYAGFWALMFAAAWRKGPQDGIETAFSRGLVASLFAVSWFGEILVPRAPSWVPPAILWWIIFAMILMAARNGQGAVSRLHR